MDVLAENLISMAWLDGPRSGLTDRVAVDRLANMKWLPTHNDPDATVISPVV